MSSFFVVHKRHHHFNCNNLSFSLSLPTDSEIVLWSTCVRSLMLGLGHPPKKTAEFEIYQNSEAYLFCLEVVCGLHSPMIGETEIFGQFKNLIKNHSFTDTYGSQKLKTILESICKDVRIVRQKHLRNLGSQSYGSVVRRLMKSGEEVHCVGAGQLAQQILPWIKKGAHHIHIYCRDPVKVRSEILKEPMGSSHVTIHSLDSSPPPLLRGTVVIAAPLSSPALLEWMGRAHFMSPSGPKTPDSPYIIDLRSESDKDPLPSFLRVRCLKEIFAEIEDNKHKLSDRIEVTQKALLELATQWDQMFQVRPFGWDDIYAAML